MNLFIYSFIKCSVRSYPEPGTEPSKVVFVLVVSWRELCEERKRIDSMIGNLTESAEAMEKYIGKGDVEMVGKRKEAENRKIEY